jgi:23S rRNA maturation mini-RNase III
MFPKKKGGCTGCQGTRIKRQRAAKAIRKSKSVDAAQYRKAITTNARQKNR